MKQGVCCPVCGGLVFSDSTSPDTLYCDTCGWSMNDYDVADFMDGEPLYVDGLKIEGGHLSDDC